MRAVMAIVIAGLVTFGPSGARTAAAQGEHDFDFLMGTWSVHNRKLKKILAGSTEWYEFDARVVDRPIMGGTGNLEEWVGDAPTGRIEGVTLRVFDPTAHEWSTLWVNKRVGTIDRPLIGAFHDKRGEFYDQEEFQGHSIFARFLWFNLSPTTARWEQAFSADYGKTWETNWIMDFTRVQS